VPGVLSAREFVYHTIQRQHKGKQLRIAVLGLSWPQDKGAWLPIVAGRALGQNHFEIVVDKSLGLPLSETLKLGKDTYTVVGLTLNMVSSGGDGMAFVTLWDSQSIQFDAPAEAIRLERAARDQRGESNELFQSQPFLTQQLNLPASQLTFLTAVGLINPPTSGEIFIGGTLVMNGPKPLVSVRSFRRHHIGYVFQKSNLIPFLTARENVQIALELN